MQRLQERDGIPDSEQIRRALRPWLESRDVLVPKDIDVIKTRYARSRKQNAANRPKRVWIHRAQLLNLGELLPVR